MPSLLSSLFGRTKPASNGPASTGDDPFERRVFEIGRDFLAEARANKDGLLSKRFWNDKLMDWSMKDEAFKVQLFRFVDTFPNFKTPDEIYEHLVDFMSQPGVKPPPGMRAGLKAGGAMKGTVAKTMAGQITGMAETFIAGTDAADAKDKLRRMWDKGLCFSVDLLGEACISDAEADAYQRKYLDLVENLPAWVNDWPTNERLEHDHLGPIPRTNVSIKCSSLVARFDPIAFDACIDEAMVRIIPILEAAKRNNVFINFDMESFATKDLTIELFKRCCETVDFRAGLAMQAYLRSGDEDAKNVIEWSQRTGRVVTVRLVKGAYWDYETIHAEEMGWPQPVWATKRETDACFERMTRMFIESTPDPVRTSGGVKLALGSHNVRSIAVALAALEKRGLPESAIELQMLYGMADPLKAAAVKRGLRVREYVPIGEMVPGMAYLVRRLLENTSNESWLKAGFLSDATPKELLASPHPTGPSGPTGSTHPTGPSGPTGSTHPTASRRLAATGDDRSSCEPAARSRNNSTNGPDRHALSHPVDDFNPPHFHTEPLRDFSQEDDRARFAKGIEVARSRQLDLVRNIEVEHAVATAVSASASWRDTPAVDRARCLIKAARLMRERRDELAGVIIRESGKTWREADADVCEAIDFCEFYAREAVGLFEPQRLGKFVGEQNELRHEPRGLCAVISPWNFPLAIACGMTTAALVTGNAVILKPAEQTPGIAKILCDLLWQAGVPKNVLHFLPGDGETVGAALARHCDVAQVAFTGSAAVGREILKAAVDHPPTGMLARHVVCETGGKNAIIVDTSADLDEAVVGVRDSAFSFAGQKCSACSRAIVVDAVYEPFVDRLVESTRSLVVGDPLGPATDVGPVIDDDAFAKISDYINRGRQEATLVYPISPPSRDRQGATPSNVESSTDERPPETLPHGRGSGHAPPSRDRQGATPSNTESPTDQRPPEALPHSRGSGPRVAGKPLVHPHIFRDVPPEASIATDEIFGPVLAIIRATDFDHAMRLALDNKYRLTGGVYTRKPSHLDRTRIEFRVGNLYLNRGCTGALVARQPFGGFGQSGLGTKAGGQDYLKQFVVPRVITENTMRRGFAPAIPDQVDGNNSQGGL
jgi:RHH-type proline utilization regulon transcriptional repressor/proline dehydrogenase/delta 1-pyrroline-5-carboxylate dehydrogenase